LAGKEEIKHRQDVLDKELMNKGMNARVGNMKFYPPPLPHHTP